MKKLCKRCKKMISVKKDGNFYWHYDPDITNGMPCLSVDLYANYFKK